MKISFIGTGKVGQLAVQYSLLLGLKDLTIINRNQDFTDGFLLDTYSAFPNKHTRIRSGEFTDIQHSDIVVITAGPTAIAGQKLAELSLSGRKVIQSIIDMTSFSPNSIVIIVTTPVDECSQYFQAQTNHPKEKVLGFGGSLDVSRLQYLLSKETGKKASTIEAYYLGKHGAPGIPVHWEKLEKPEKVSQFSKHYFKEVASRTDSSTLYGPAYQLALLIQAVAQNTKEVFGVSTWDKEHQIYFTWPAVVGKEGVLELKDINLNNEQQQELRQLLETERDLRKS